ncbi:MAG: hypothetical protein EOP83_03045, partial [Verrucomicrobiaceae bacterium]
MRYPHISSCRAVLLASAASLTVITASAATLTWDGGGDLNWQTPANWIDDVAPVANDALVFAGSINLSPQNNFPAGTNFSGLSFAAGASAFTLSGNEVTLRGNVANNSANTQTAGIPLTLGSGASSFTGSTTTGATLALGTITAPANSGAVALFTPNAGTITTTTANTNGILGGWASTGVTTNGANWASANGSNEVVAYTGYSVVALNATIPSNAASNVLVSGDAAVGPDNTDINTLKTSTVVGTGGNDITIAAGATLRFGTMGGILHDNAVANNMRIGSNTTGTGNSTITAGGTESGTPGMLVLNTPSTASNHNNVLGLLSTIADNGIGGTVTVVKTGLSSAYFDANNSYSGGTFIHQGHIQGNRSNSFGTGDIRVSPGGQAYLNATATFANNLYLSGNGLPVDNTGAVRFSNATVTGTITLDSNSRVNVNGNTTANVNGKITGPFAFDLYGTGGSGNQPNLVLGNTANDWSGDTTVISHTGNANALVSNLRLGASEVIPHGAGKGNLTLTATAASTTAGAKLQLNGFNETINGLNSPVGTRFEVTNAGAAGPATLTLGENDANGDFGGSLRDLTLDDAFSIVKNGSGTQIIRGGSSIYFGSTTVNGGRLEFVGSAINDGPITVASGATFASNALVTGPVTISDGGKLASTGINSSTLEMPSLSLGSNTSINTNTASLPSPTILISGDLQASGPADSVTLNVDGGSPIEGQHPLISYGGSLLGTGYPAFKLGTLPPRVEGTLYHDSSSKIIGVNVTGTDSPIWTGAQGSAWSTAVMASPKNWKLTSNSSPTDFISNDQVLFDDSASNNTVAISTTDVHPKSVTFANNSDTFLITGSMGIAGSSDLVMNGGGKTIIANPNTYIGGTAINAGTLQVGNGNAAGSLGTGPVSNSGELILDGTNDHAFPNLIQGSGTVRKTGTGTLTLTAANLHDGTTIVAQGTLRVINNNVLGPIPGGGADVLAGGAIDIAGNPTVNNQDFGQKQFTIAGNGPSDLGALVNSGIIAQNNAFERVALSADASIGGTGRYDIRATVDGLGQNQSVLDLAGQTLRKRGTNQITCVATNLTAGNIIVEQGTFAIESSSATGGTGSILFHPGTQAAFFQNQIVIQDAFGTGGVTWPITVREGVVIGNAGTAVATVPAPFILEGNAILSGFNAALPAPELANRPLLLTGTISESGGAFSLTKNGLNTITLSGTGSSYTGATVVNAGTLVVDGSINASPFTVTTGATLGGTGIIGGSVTSDGIISPSLATIGTLSTGATSFSATGSYAAQIDSGTLTADQLAVTGNLQLGGMLTVTDLGAATLNVGDKLVLASCTGTVSGAFINAPDGGTFTIGANTFAVDYDDVVAGQTSITLTVAAGTAYDNWATSKGLDGTNNGKLQDPDNDGIANIIEFGMDGNPLSGANDGKTRLAITD